VRAALFEGGRLRLAGVLLAGFLVLELIAYGIAGVMVSGAGSNDRQAVVAQLKTLSLEGVLDAPSAKPTKLDEPRGMGSQHAGLALLALSEVDSVRTKSGTRRAPEGSTLLAFRVGDWVCEIKPCEGWQTLHPRVTVDGRSESLPDGGSTYVVVLPPGTELVSLDIGADGFDQSLSLRDDTVGDGNIALLAEKGRTARTVLNQRFTIGERTSIPLQDAAGQVSDTFTREVTVEYYERRFFFDGVIPSGPDKTFLIVNTYYNYAGQTQNYVPLDEVTFVDKRGRTYTARDVDPDDAVALIGFEIPADVQSGSFRIGGSRTKTSTNGQSYTSTLGEHAVPLKLG
jgi:hypothetical protein